MSEDNNIVVNNAELSAENTSETYSRIRNSVITAQGKIYTAVNSAMVQALLQGRRKSLLTDAISILTLCSTTTF